MRLNPESDNHIRRKVKIVLDLSNYATKKELVHPAVVHTSDLAAKKNLLVLKVRLISQTLIKLVNVPTDLNDFKTKVEDLGTGKMKTVFLDLKK